MAENDEPGPVLPPDPAAEAEPAAHAEPTPAQPVLKTRWRDRAWSFRAMLAVALATLVLGGVAGGSIVALADDDHDGHGRFRMGPADRMPPGWRNPRGFEDGGRGWRWNDGPQPPPGNTTPYGPQSSPPSPSPSQ